MTAATTLPAGKPELTLGWGVLGWCSQWIRQPDGPDAGGSWTFTAEQVRFILWWFAVDERGRWFYTRGVLRRAKGWGKTPVVGALALAELCGPVRFDRFDRCADGGCVGQPVSAAWVQLAGVSEKQTVNTMSMVLAMVTESPIVDAYGLDLGLTRIFTAAGGRLEPITASAPTAEGARPTFICQDETQHWTESNNGTDLDRVNRRNLGKSRDGSARMLETTNAHASGVDSVAERSYQAWQMGSGGLLYDAREAAGEVDLGDDVELMAALVAAYGDSTWVDLERIRAEVLDFSTPHEDSRRFYLNQIAAASDSWITEPQWAGRFAGQRIVADGELVTLGFDGSRHRARGVTDATALVACCVSDGFCWPVEVWEQPSTQADWQVPASLVDSAVRGVFDRYDVAGFYADPAKWETYVAQWEAAYGSKLRVHASRQHPIEWWMTSGRSVATVRTLELFRSAVIDGGMSHDGSSVLGRHVLNARMRLTTSGVQIAKEFPDSPRKIDAAIASVLAFQARTDAVAAGVKVRTDEFTPRRVR